MSSALIAPLRRDAGVEQRATTLELFYDPRLRVCGHAGLALLLDHLNCEGVGQSALVLLVVWWSWNYTTCVTNELDPRSVVVRCC